MEKRDNLSRAEQSRAEQSRAEQSRAEQSRAEQSRAEQSTNVATVRQSGIELLRIVMMLEIIAHHYVVNSGLLDIISVNMLSSRSLFLLILGWGGKYAINCFIMITGYFMCKQEITLKKFLKLFLEIEFYNIVIYFLFLITGYDHFSIKNMVKAVLPVYSIGTGFLASYLIFFLLIPYLNILIKGMEERVHIRLIVLCILVFTLFPSFLKADVKIGYVGWFMVVYIIAAYIRLYPKKWFDNSRIWGIATIILLILSWGSVVACTWLSSYLGKAAYYYFVNDSNKILALLPAITTFMYFKNLQLGYKKWINNISSTTFGVLLIHANSDTMRQWLWRDILGNAEVFYSEYFVIHAVLSVLGVYIICVMIDLIRLKWLEKPLFRTLDKMALMNL